jgi:RNA polymerase sigma factor (TIGR02999 family)
MTTAPWTELLQDAESNLPGAKERLFASLYRELRGLAERQLRRAGSRDLSPTTLLHETYLDLAHGHAQFPSRGQFMAYAARAMRGLVIDFSRERRALKRGAGFQITHFDTLLHEQLPAGSGGTPDLDCLAEAIDELALQDAALAELVELKFFCGFSSGEIAEMRQSSERTVQRDWEKARLFLFHAMNGRAAR